MYPFLGFLLIFLILMSIIFYCRKRKIVKKIRCMSPKEKCRKLNELLDPFGYYYDPCQDVFSSTLHPWQRNFGYGKIYDQLAPHFQMVIDCLPVYFDYDKKTYLIEFWKGQYGINTGAEIGVYKANRILTEWERPLEIFEAVSDDELLRLGMKLKRYGRTISRLSMPQWWLTVFHVGLFSQPKDLSMDISITFPDYDMLHAFTDGLKQTAFSPDTLYVHGLTASFDFNRCTTTCHYKFWKRQYIKYVQWKNRTFCRLFLAVTSPFYLSMDRVLYLYEYAPFAFRRLFTIHHYQTGGRRKKQEKS